MAMSEKIRIRLKSYDHMLIDNAAQRIVEAAKKAGSKRVCIPKDNVKDLEDISEEILNGLDIVPVSAMDEVLAVALV